MMSDDLLAEQKVFLEWIGETQVVLQRKMQMVLQDESMHEQQIRCAVEAYSSLKALSAATEWTIRLEEIRREQEAKKLSGVT